ncbi:MAG TPA: hypothetical protein VLS89_17210, partial [Candidatus Nanopelagicales bacterium]|nr:hypothetical protein [Candidatus Nanopelagicales bacterium]
MSVRKLAPWVLLAGVIAPSCFDRSTRWEVSDAPPAPPACPAGELRCSIGRLERCEGSGASLGWAVIEDCGSQGLVCGSVEL